MTNTMTLAVNILRKHLVDISKITHVTIDKSSKEDDCASFIFWNCETVTGFEVYLNDLSGEHYDITSWYEVYSDDYKAQKIKESEVFIHNAFCKKAINSEITTCNDGFVKSIADCGATNVKITTQKNVENNDEITFDLNGKCFLISSARTGNIQNGSYLNFTSLVSESIPRA
jgi:hypothetical protein